jgi:hypothetical protein
MKIISSMIKFSFTVLFSLCVVFQNAYSREAQGADFLLLGVDARTSAMGEGLDAVSNYSNPAAAASIETSEVSAMHDEYLLDYKEEFLGISHNFENIGVVGINATYLHTDIQGRDSAGNRSGNFQAYDLSAGVSYARELSKHFSAGLSCKMIQQNIEQATAMGQAVDLGLMYKLDKLNLGASLLNLGTRMKFIREEYALPLVVNVGASYAFDFATLGVNIKQQPYQDYASIGLGGECWLLNFFSVRAGYTIEAENDQGSLFGASAGVGFKFKDSCFDYCFNPYADLGQTHRLTMRLKFGHKPQAYGFDPMKPDDRPQKQVSPKNKIKKDLKQKVTIDAVD